MAINTDNRETFSVHGFTGIVKMDTDERLLREVKRFYHLDIFHEGKPSMTLTGGTFVASITATFFFYVFGKVSAFYKPAEETVKYVLISIYYFQLVLEFLFHVWLRKKRDAYFYLFKWTFYVAIINVVVI
jgi:hypothetical protein